MALLADKDNQIQRIVRLINRDGPHREAMLDLAATCGTNSLHLHEITRLDRMRNPGAIRSEATAAEIIRAAMGLAAGMAPIHGHS